MRRSRATRPVSRALIAVTVASLAAAAIIMFARADAVDSFVALARKSAPLGAAILFAWSFVLFLTAAPFGTATILIAGAVLGAWAGWVQFAALILSSIVVFEFAGGNRRDEALALLDARPRLARTVRLLRRRGALLSAVLRIAPVMPSAACGLICAGLGVDRAKFVAGTILAGWVRPVGFAYAGAAGASMLLSS